MHFGPRQFLIIVAWTFGLTCVRANIGEDVTQLRHRYGGAQDMGGQMLFQHNGYSICVYFDGSHSAMEVFLRDGSVKGKDDINQKDIDDILAQEGEGMPWTPTTSRSGKPTWVRADGRLVARFTEGSKPEDKFIMIMLNAR